MKEGRGGVRGEVMVGREERWKDSMKEFGKDGAMASMKVIFGVSNSFTKMQLYHGIQTSLSLFFLDKMLITVRHEAGPVSRQWARRPGARSSITTSGLHIPDGLVEETEA